MAKNAKKELKNSKKNPKKMAENRGGGNPLWPPILLGRVWPWWLAVVAGEEKKIGGIFKKNRGDFFLKNRGDFFKN